MADLTTAKILLLFVVFLHEFYSGFSHPNADSDETITWAEYKKKYGKVYNGEDDKKHEKIFNENLEIIKKHNIVYGEGKSTWKAGVNKFTDMNLFDLYKIHKNDEKYLKSRLSLCGLKKKYTNDFVNYERHGIKFMKRLKTFGIPPSVDWRKNQAVTPVMNEGFCHSDYAIAAVSALSSNAFISKNTSTLIPLSAQEIIDCSHRVRACDEGTILDALNYVKNEGVYSNSTYPYVGAQEGHCRKFHPVNPTKIRFKYFEEECLGNEHHLTKMVARGPVAVTLSVNITTFTHYSGGVYNDPSYKHFASDRSLLLVGYGYNCAKTGVNEYWILKNSWGTAWGEGGYVRVPRNNHNMYNIANSAYRPYFSLNKF